MHFSTLPLFVLVLSLASTTIATPGLGDDLKNQLEGVLNNATGNLMGVVSSALNGALSNVNGKLNGAASTAILDYSSKMSSITSVAATATGAAQTSLISQASALRASAQKVVDNAVASRTDNAAMPLRTAAPLWGAAAAGVALALI
jgi:hypothetical protein